MALINRGRLATMLIVAALSGSGCGASGDAGGKALPAAVANGLAARAEHVAAALEGGACDQARDEAQALQSDVAALKVEPSVQAEAAARAERLVAAINCPPPTTATTAVTAPTIVVGEPRTVKGKKHKGGHDDDD